MQDSSVFIALSSGASAIDQLNKGLDIEELVNIKDKLEDQKLDMEEKQEFFISAGQTGDEDELLDELN